MAFPNPFQNPDFYQRIKIGGRQIKAPLVAVSGISKEHDWNEQRSTGNSSATFVFRGTKPAGPPTLTFEAVDAAMFDDLRELYELTEPTPGYTPPANGNTQGSTGSAAYGAPYVRASSPDNPATTASPSADELLKQAQSSLAALQSGASAPAVTPSASTQVSILTPGPKPPTLSVENGWLNFIGITAISSKKFELSITATNSYRFAWVVVPQRPLQKASVGPASPQRPDNPGKTIALGEIQPGPTSAAKAANAQAAAWGAR